MFPRARPLLVATLIVASLFTTLAHPLEVGLKTEAASKALKSLSVKHDDMEGINWYRSKTSPRNADSNAFYLYFGKDSAGFVMPLRLVIRYSADSWLFVENAWARADGDKVVPPQAGEGRLGWKRDNGGGSIWEWSDVAVTSPSDIAVVRKIAEAKSVTVRFNGRQYYNDRKLTDVQLKALREMISAYEAATGKPWK